MGGVTWSWVEQQRVKRSIIGLGGAIESFKEQWIVTRSNRELGVTTEGGRCKREIGGVTERWEVQQRVRRSN